MDKQENCLVVNERADTRIAEQPKKQKTTVKIEIPHEENVFKLLRIAHGLSKTELAKKLDCSPALVTAVENGQRRISRAMLSKMANAYEMNEVHIFHLLNEYDVADEFADMEIENSFKAYRKELLNILSAIAALEQ